MATTTLTAASEPPWLQRQKLRTLKRKNLDSAMFNVGMSTAAGEERPRPSRQPLPPLKGEHEPLFPHSAGQLHLHQQEHDDGSSHHTPTLSASSTSAVAATTANTTVATQPTPTPAPMTKNHPRGMAPHLYLPKSISNKLNDVAVKAGLQQPNQTMDTNRPQISKPISLRRSASTNASSRPGTSRSRSKHNDNFGDKYCDKLSDKLSENLSDQYSDTRAASVSSAPATSVDTASEQPHDEFAEHLALLQAQVRTNMEQIDANETNMYHLARRDELLREDLQARMARAMVVNERLKQLCADLRKAEAMLSAVNGLDEAR